MLKFEALSQFVSMNCSCLQYCIEYKSSLQFVFIINQLISTKALASTAH